jgi:hypothetical protein
MSSTYIQRITCDNPDCLVYADELIREFPGQYEVREYVRSQIVVPGWTHGRGWDLCPTHASTSEVMRARAYELRYASPNQDTDTVG